MPPIRITSRIISSRVPFRTLPSTITPFSHSRYYASESYGSSSDKENDPAHSHTSSKATHDMEHPGPPPPGTDSGSSSSSSSPKSDSERQPESSPPAPERPSNNASPKISDQSSPPEPSEDAKKHNEEFEKRYERSSNRLSEDGKDRVEKGFWSGQGGRQGE